MGNGGDALGQDSTSGVTVSSGWTKKPASDGGAGWTTNCEEVSMCCFTCLVLTSCSILGGGDCDFFFVTDGWLF